VIYVSGEVLPADPDVLSKEKRRVNQVHNRVWTFAKYLLVWQE